MKNQTNARTPFTRRRFMQAGAAAAAGLCWSRSLLAADDAPTVVFRRGVVLPVDAGFSQQSAMALRGNRILAVGSDEAVTELAGKHARVVDLAGRTLLPGFIEPHMHFALMAGLGHFRDVGPFKNPTFDDALGAIREIHRTAKAAGPDDWVTGRQFDPILLEPPRELTTRDLDPLLPDRPAFFLNASGHIAYVNSKTLELGGITRNTPDPAGGEIGRYEDGTPNGVLYGQATFLPILLQNKNFTRRMQDDFVGAGIDVGNQAAALGITTLCDQATGGFAGASELDSYHAMYSEGAMNARIRAYLYDESGDSFRQAGTRPGQGDSLMRVAGWKIVTDGSNQGFTGRQREPYYTRDTRGLFYVEPEALKNKVLELGRAGWPISLHGNGDAAIDSILDAVAYARAGGVDVKALRIRIEHCSILHDDQIARMKPLGICPSFLINHVHYWGHVMRDEVFGPKKVQLLDRCAAVEKAGLTWVNHTDAPVSPLGSLHKIRVATARDLWKEPETILAPQERVSVEAAIRAVTRNAAFLCHSEHELGSLEPGKLADFVILEEDPRKVEPRTISGIRISETWMDGRQVFSG